MPLTPATYKCPTHPQVDLTSRVLEALEDEGPPVAFGKRPFRVQVTCPGDGSGAHMLMASGERET
ncbi:hypothetical protein ACQPX6_00235 [Actinomycetospora sp. CA-101289]|uniref:hypothetical protein n=1 Tax=Actinomycetospora sp. CA-101289 TaxID=3239893 RepID=UPI003D994D52